MKFFFTATGAIRLDAVMAVDLDYDNDEPTCQILLVGGKQWYLNRDEGLRLLETLRLNNE